MAPTTGATGTTRWPSAAYHMSAPRANGVNRFSTSGADASSAFRPEFSPDGSPGRTSET